MKKIYAYPAHLTGSSFLALVAALILAVPAAQATTQTDAFPLGTVQSYVAGFVPADNGRQQITVQVDAGTSFMVEVDRNEITATSFKVYGAIAGHKASRFFIDGEGQSLKGNVILMDTRQAWSIYSDEAGNAWVKPADINKVVCANYTDYKEETNYNPSNLRTSAAPALQSFPGATGTVYLDFDGENVSGGRWGSISAAASAFTDQQITDIWQGVAEDYLPFNVNVTTVRSVYTAAPVNRRMMVIFTPTDDASPGAGGVAYLGSFSDNSNDPCWVFNLGVKGALEAASHEVGHTFNLNHDGDAIQGVGYYAGHGSWGPIMGASYGVPLVQWSQGEYEASDNGEDDLATISATYNGVGYRTDDHGNTTGAATNLNADGSGNVLPANNNGIISTTTDKDVFKFHTPGGPADLKFTSRDYANVDDPDLDIQVRLLNSGGTEVLKSDPVGLEAEIKTSLSPGDYYLEIDGVGYLDPLNTGYSDYASLGYFEISGTITVGADGQPPVAEFVHSGDDCSGVVQFTDQSLYNVTSWLWDFGDGSTSSQQSPLHTYTASGTYTVKLTVSGPDGQDDEIKTSTLNLVLPEVTSTTGATSCTPASVTLNATGAGTLQWYDAATNGNMVGTGTSYTTPVLNNTTSYWVEAKHYDIQGKVGPVSNTIGTGAYFVANDIRGQWFDVHQPVTIKTVKVYAEFAGNRTIQVMTNSGTIEIHNKTVYCPQGESRVALDFAMQPGTDYFIKCLAPDPATLGLWRNDAGASYPYDLQGVVTITESNASIPGYYYYFYDWELERSCTSSPRSEVVAEIGCTGMDETASGIGLQVFPNPLQDIFTVAVDGLQDDARFEIFNAIGQKVMDREIDASVKQVQINASSLPAGLYRVRVIAANGAATRNIVKQ